MDSLPVLSRVHIDYFKARDYNPEHLHSHFTQLIVSFQTQQCSSDCMCQSVISPVRESATENNLAWQFPMGWTSTRFSHPYSPLVPINLTQDLHCSAFQITPPAEGRKLPITGMKAHKPILQENHDAGHGTGCGMLPPNPGPRGQVCSPGPLKGRCRGHGVQINRVCFLDMIDCHFSYRGSA